MGVGHLILQPSHWVPWDLPAFFGLLDLTRVRVFSEGINVNLGAHFKA